LHSPAHRLSEETLSRSKLKSYEVIDNEPITIEENRKNKIELQRVKTESKDDNFMRVKSEQKGVKEESTKTNQ